MSKSGGCDDLPGVEVILARFQVYCKFSGGPLSKSLMSFGLPSNLVFLRMEEIVKNQGSQGWKCVSNYVAITFY
jgi:hypothetical protein